MNGRREEFSRFVWAPDPKEGFKLCKLRDIGAEMMTVELIDSGTTITAAYDDVFPAEENRRKDVDDNCALMYLNEGTLLNNCRLRYARKQIYTYVANILISINPYEQIRDLYSSSTIKKYQGKSIGTLPPHIFAIADSAYRDMRRQRQSQSIIVSGESGAGKTESQKYILCYLCESWGSTAGPIEQRILETNPILEAFGNAKTLRNNNSSRFGKFAEVHFSSKYTVAGGFISHYLLEKSRICRQQSEERNYHVFYQLIAGADDQMAKRLKLQPASSFTYLKRGCTQFFSSAATSSKITKERRGKKPDLHDELVDDYGDFQRLRKALYSIGLSEKDLTHIFDVVSAVLHLGNINFVEDLEDAKGGCMVADEGSAALHNAASLLGLDDYELHSGLTTRIMQPPKSGSMGTIIRVPLKPHEAAAARDALAKAIYSNLFDTIVASINKCIPFGDSVSYIGVLDIAGFEFFMVNSFEQFCINYCNEKLQYFFNERILKQEQDLYAKEGLNVPRIEYNDNEDCIDLFERRIDGLLDLLDEEARLPKPSPLNFTATAHQRLKNHFRLSTPRKSKLREHKEMRDNEGLLIRHFAGSVCYQTALFLEKNNDALHTSLEMLMDNSSVPFVKNLFAATVAIKSGQNHRKQTNKLAIASVSNKFRSQLTVLLEKLEKTSTHFVRCIKPNSEMQAGKFEGAMIMSQLKCAGMTSVLRLMQKGYPSRTPFAELYKMYEKILPSRLARLDPRLFCKCLFHTLGLNDRDFKFGQTKVFFRPGKFAEFDQMLRQDPANMDKLVKKVQSWLLHVRWKKAQYGVLSCIKLKNKILYRSGALTSIQSALRGYLVRKIQLPRLKLYQKTSHLSDRIAELEDMLKGMSSSSQQRWSPTIKEIANNTRCLLSDIKRSDGKQLGQLNGRYDGMVNKIDAALSSLRQQAVSDERERIKQLEEKQRLEKEKEKQRNLEETRHEKERQERIWIEEKRKKEEEEYHRKQEILEAEAEREKQLKLQQEEKIKQERLDRELAKRLAQENNTVQIVDSNTIKEINGGPSKFAYLTQCKYAELRDIINTSTDPELLMACKDEFHRRLQIYQQWKQRNPSSGGEPQNTRVPMALMVSGSQGYTRNDTNRRVNIQRYFKVPFARPFSGHLDMIDLREIAGSHGMWYAHFDGQWIARQMELHPNRKPVLLVAGRDDMDMCELSLDATQLTRKKGAEIPANEFEALWQRCGGPPYQKNMICERM